MSTIIDDDRSVTEGQQPRRGKGSVPAEALAGLAVLLTMAVVTILAPVLAPADPLALDMLRMSEAPVPSWSGLLGTDELGRDVLSRVLYGGRTVLLLAALGAVAGTGVGLIFALWAASQGGWVDQVLSRIGDALLAVPNLVLAIILIAFAGYSFGLTMVVIVLATWILPYRVCRSVLKSTLANPYIEASRMAGLTAFEIARHHLVPVVAPQIVVILSINFTAALMLVSSLGYLGLGVQPPTPDWGQMVAASQGQIGLAWWTPVFAGLAIVLTALGAQLLGDAFARRLSLADKTGATND